MHRVTLPLRGTAKAWRAAARALAADGVPAADVAWSVGEGAAGLFDAVPLPAGEGRKLTVPRAFLELAAQVLCHRDPEAPALLYQALLALQDRRGLLDDPADPLVRRLNALAKAVRRDMHKMRAFLRFRELPSDDLRLFDTPGEARRWLAGQPPAERS